MLLISIFGGKAGFQGRQVGCCRGAWQGGTNRMPQKWAMGRTFNRAQPCLGAVLASGQRGPSSSLACAELPLTRARAPLHPGCCKLHPASRHPPAGERNYPTDADSSPGEWQTETGAPRGCPGRIPLPSGSAANRHTLPYSEPG